MNITVDKKKILRALEETKSLIKHYERYYPLVYKHISPKRLHAAVSALSSAIEKCENFSSWYWDVKALFDALDELNRNDVLIDARNGDSAKAARAFGKLFVALANLAMRIPNPIAKAYAQTLKQFGDSFEQIVGTFSPDHGNKEYTESLRRFGQGRQDY